MCTVSFEFCLIYLQDFLNDLLVNYVTCYCAWKHYLQLLNSTVKNKSCLFLFGGGDTSSEIGLPFGRSSKNCIKERKLKSPLSVILKSHW